MFQRLAAKPVFTGPFPYIWKSRDPTLSAIALPRRRHPLKKSMNAQTDLQSATLNFADDQPETVNHESSMTILAKQDPSSIAPLAKEEPSELNRGRGPVPVATADIPHSALCTL